MSFSAPEQSTWAHCEHMIHIIHSSPLESSENFLSQNIHEASSFFNGVTPSKGSITDDPLETLETSSLDFSSAVLSKLRRFFTASFPFLDGAADLPPRPRLVLHPRALLRACFSASLASLAFLLLLTGLYKAWK